MPRYIIERVTGALTAEELQAAARKSMTIRLHAKLAGLPVDSIAEVSLEVSPSMFV